MREAYIAAALRTPGCKREKGAFAQTRPEDLISHVLRSVVELVPGVTKKDVEDIVIGCCFPEAEQGLNIGRIAAQMAGFPDETSGATVNRFCASGLEAIAIQSMRIMSGFCDVAIAGGVESMTMVPMTGNLPRPHPVLAKEKPDVYISMGMTAENIARHYNISRAMQDEFAYHSQLKASEAQKNKAFDEIVPTPAFCTIQKDGSIKYEQKMQNYDDGVRHDTTLDALSKLPPAFASGGSVTAGNSSQTTDGAAAVLLMSADAVNRFGVKPVAKFKYYTVTGVKPGEMGVGPAYAIPKLLKMAGLSIDDIGLFEINEAFASQAIYCMRELGLYDKKELWQYGSVNRKVNVNGGAIALGHPIGCSGSKLAAQLINMMKKNGVKYGVESMCVGGGMGAAALFELV